MYKFYLVQRENYLNQELALSTQFPQQKPTTICFLAGLLEIGHLSLPALTFLTNALTSELAFFAHLVQQTLKIATLSAFTAFPENGHSALTGTDFLAAVKKKAIERILARLRSFFMLNFMVSFLSH